MALARKSTEHAFIHFWGTDEDVGVREIRRAHRKLGMMEVGFHYIIRRDGTLEVGRAHEKCGNHMRGYNHNSLGVCVVAASKETITEAQDLMVASFCETAKKMYPGIDVRLVQPKPTEG